MRPHYKTRECMMTPTILHLIRTIAMMVLGWLPFHLGGTGSEQPQRPTWGMVDQPPYLQMILGYTNETLTNETLWYPFRHRSPWAKNRERKYTLYIDYETPWITERLEADYGERTVPLSERHPDPAWACAIEPPSSRDF
jgi:hypothetical protein